MTLLAILVVIVVGYVLLDRWGRQPVVEPLESAGSFNVTVVRLVRRGSSGTAIELSWPSKGVRIIVEKGLGSAGQLSLRVHDVSEQHAQADSVHELTVDDFVGERGEVAHTGQAVRAIRHDVEARAVHHGVQLVPGALASFRGPVLAFNVQRATGIPDDGRLF